MSATQSANLNTNQFKKLAQNPKLIAYWRLFLAVTMPVIWSRLLLFVGIGTLAAGFGIDFFMGFVNLDQHPFISFIPKLIMIIGAVLCGIFPLMAIMVLPSQMLTLASSKQFSLLAQVRVKLALVLASLLILVSVMFALFALKQNKPPAVIMQAFIMCFLVSSSIILFTIYAVHRFPMAQFFVGFGIMAFSFLFDRLRSVEITYLCGLVGLIWATFLYWWLNWRPQKYHRSFLIEGMNNPAQAQQLQLNLWAMQFTISNKARSWLGSRFLGRSDSAINTFYMSFVGFSIGILILYLIFFMFIPHVSHQGASNFSTGHSAMVLVYSMIIASAYGAQLATAQLTHFKKTWFYFMGQRSEIFHTIERLCFKQYVIQMSAVIFPLILLFFIVPILGPLKKIVVLGFAMGICQAIFHFYLNLWMYQKFKASRNWIMGINIFATLVIFTPCFIFGLYAESLMNLWPYFILALVSCFVVTLLLRLKVKHNWATIEFIEAH